MINRLVKIIAINCSNVYALLLQIQYLGVYKGGLNMETMSIGEFPVYGALIMLLVDCILYALIAVYFGLVVEGLLLL